MLREYSASKKEDCVPTIYTIGHSNLEANEFIHILHHYQMQLVADVRSKPYSQYCPQFNKDIIEQALNNSGINYLFLGKELGARPEEQSFYVDGKVSFEKLKISDIFRKGITKLIEEARKSRTVIMCSEKEPINCHRSILISRVLVKEGVKVKHIIDEKEVLEHCCLEERLLKKFNIRETLFDTESSKQASIEEAYEQQEKIILHKRQPKSFLLLSRIIKSRS
jgi:uncharacterized protein (DUF488 family)